MLLKLIVLALSLFMGGVGVLRASVLYENYALLVAGLVLATIGVLVPLGPARAQPVAT